MRFLATGDIQAHNWKQFSYIRKDGMNSRLYNCLKVFRIILREAKERDITKVLLNGDLFEENAFIEVEVYDSVYEEVRKLYDAGLEVVLNVGNHDILRLTDGRIVHALRPFGKVARVIETPTLVWRHLQVVPWVEKPDEFKRIVAALDSQRGEAALALHCGVQGATTGPTSYLVRNPIKLADIRPEDFNVIILSDYHTQQSLAKNVFYLGSPLQHTAGEIHRPAIWDIHTDGKTWLAKRIPTKLPEFVRARIGRGETVDALEGSLRELDGNYVRVETRAGTRATDHDIEKYARKHGFLVQIEHRGADPDSQEAEIKALAPEEAISRYVKKNVKRQHRDRLRRLGEKLYNNA